MAKKAQYEVIEIKRMHRTRKKVLVIKRLERPIEPVEPI